MNIIFMRHVEAIDNVLESINSLPDKMYVSPLPRTVETAHYVYEKYPKLDNVILKQIDGDYSVRFGEYGKNKCGIKLGLCKFLSDIYKYNFKDNTILIVSHGSITSYMKRLLCIKSLHIKTGKIEGFIDVNFEPLFEYYGINRRYLTVDSDELFIYKYYENITLDEFINREKYQLLRVYDGCLYQ